ncbi:MAG: ribonuclease H-like domain-containing protein [Lysobacteraceae bacterium]
MTQAATLDRLRLLRRQAGQGASAAPVPAPASVPAVAPRATSAQTIDDLRRLLRVRAPAPARAAPDAHDRALTGEELAPGLRLVESLQPWDAPLPARMPLAFARREDDVATADVLFFDTETTGLAGGTGTRAFMIGAARWTDAGLHVRQWYLTAMAAERDLLTAFAETLAPGTVLASYNGRSYDAPLLAARYRLARMANPLPACDHVDLLHPVRRRYRGRWENCRLATIERRVLGIVREDDLPGSEAPAAWLRYLRGGSARDLRRVADHNRQDLVSLAGVWGHLVVCEDVASSG